MELSRSDLLDALAADIHADGKTLPCLVLRQLLLNEPIHRFKRETVDEALQLVGVYHRLAKALITDLAVLESKAPESSHSPRARQSNPQRVEAGCLKLAPLDLGGRVLLPLSTYQFLSALPSAWVLNLVRWAPPVISLGAKKGEPLWVIESVFSGFLARQAIPNESVWVRVLADPAKAQINVLEVARFWQERLSTIYQEHRDRIIALAPSLEAAQLVSGLQRAMTARIRQQASKKSGEA